MLTRCNLSKNRFICCFGDFMLRIGCTLRKATSPVRGSRTARRGRTKRRSTFRFLSRSINRCGQAAVRRRSSKQGIHRAITSQFKNDRLPLMIQHNLKGQGDPGAKTAHKSRTEEHPWHQQFDDVVAEHLKLMYKRRRLMHKPAEEIWDRLCLVVIHHTRPVAPAGVAAYLDQAGSEHAAK